MFSLSLAGGGSLINQAGGEVEIEGGRDSGIFEAPGDSFVNDGLLVALPNGSETIEGNYNQGPTGTFQVDIDGTVAETQYSQLNVTGTANLDGTLDVMTGDGFVPADMETFEVLTFGSASGTFATYDGTTLSNGLVLQPDQTSSDLTLTALPIQADLVVGVTSLPAQVPAGGDVTYLVTLTNDGPYYAQGVVLTDTLPSDVSDVTATASVGSPSISGSLITLDLATLADGASVTLTIVATPTSTGLYTDTASVADTFPVDPNPSNNSGSASSYVVGVPSSVIATAGSPQSAAIGTAFATDLQATVEDENSNPVPGVTVTFAAPTSGADGLFAGGLATVIETTNAQGVATAPAFTANTVSGGYAVIASVSGVASPASFLLTNAAGPATTVLVASGSPQTAVVGTAFAVAMEVSVEDRYGNPVPGVLILFSAPAGVSGFFAGGLVAVNAVTNAQGVASAPAFTAGTIAGAYAVIATVSGVSSQAKFSLTNAAGPAATLLVTSGSPQSAVVGTAFASAFQATVEDKYGNPVPGAIVTFAAPSSGAGGNFSGSRTSTATTNALGLATAPSFTAGTGAGSYLVVATVPGAASSASYNLTNKPGAASIVLTTAGTPQTAVVGTAFATAMQATVEDQYGNLLAGVTVTFTVPAGVGGGNFPGGLGTASATTNALGVASAPSFTANTLAGGYVVIATVKGVTSQASFSLTNAAGAASNLVAVIGSGQSSVVGAAFAVAMQASVEDKYGNPIAGLIVTFAAPSSGAGGNFSGVRTSTATTNALGMAKAPTFTAGTAVGSYVVVATVSGVAAPASFNMTNSIGVASSVAVAAGSPQSAAVGAAFASPLQARVADKYGNPVAGVTVTFAAPAGGAGGRFAGGLATVTTTTNSAGLASAPALTAGVIAGGYTVTATISGVTSGASFRLTNVAATSTTLAVPAGPQLLGHALILTATVSGLAPAVTHPTGLVTFFDGSKSLGSATLNASGQATFTTSALGAGIHSLTATYAGDPSDLTSASAAVPLRIGGVAAGAYDFDGDGKADLAIYDQTNATFYIQESGGGVVIQALGYPNDKNIPINGDFDGDGKADLAVYDQTLAEFFVHESGGGLIAQPFGSPRDVNVPVAGDFDGDGKTDLAIYDQTTSAFYILESGGGTIVQLFGNATHINIPVAGDFDGDGKTDLAIYDQSLAEFVIAPSGGGPGRFTLLGSARDKNVPVAGDFDGDGKSDLAVYDQTIGELFVVESKGGTIAQPFGIPADANLPVPGDYDGDGRTDIAIYDPALDEFFVIESGGGTIVHPIGIAKHKNLPA